MLHFKQINGIVGLLLAGVIVVCALRRSALLIPQVPFDAEQWKATHSLVHHSQSQPTLRQKMISDLVTNVLPGKNRRVVEDFLGPSPSHDDMRRYRPEDFVVQRDKNEASESIRATGNGYSFDMHDWDLIYEIGPERIFIFDDKGVALSPDAEWLILRFGHEGAFESWYIVGSSRWPAIAGELARKSYRPTR